MPMFRKGKTTEVFEEFSVGTASHAYEQQMVVLKIGETEILFHLDEAEFMHQQVQKAMRQIRTNQPRILLTDKIGVPKAT